MAELNVTSPYHLTTASLDDAPGELATWIVVNATKGHVAVAARLLPHPGRPRTCSPPATRAGRSSLCGELGAIGIGFIHTDAERAHLGRFYAHPDVRGRTSARHWSSSSGAWARLGYQRVTLNVYKHNTIARQLCGKRNSGTSAAFHEAPGQRTGLRHGRPRTRIDVCACRVR